MCLNFLFLHDPVWVDFMFLETGEPILCEINSNAFFEEFEKVTGINVAKEYALMIKRKIYE